AAAAPYSMSSGCATTASARLHASSTGCSFSTSAPFSSRFRDLRLTCSLPRGAGGWTGLTRTIRPGYATRVDTRIQPTGKADKLSTKEVECNFSIARLQTRYTSSLSRGKIRFVGRTGSQIPRTSGDLMRTRSILAATIGAAALLAAVPVGAALADPGDSRQARPHGHHSKPVTKPIAKPTPKPTPGAGDTYTLCVNKYSGAIRVPTRF